MVLFVKVLILLLGLHMSMTPEQLAQTDIQAGWPLPDVAQFVAIQIGESGGNPNIVGWDANGKTVADTLGNAPDAAFSSYDTGLAQINSIHNPKNPPGVFDPQWITKMQNPVQNSKTALGLFNAGGWGPWSSDGIVASGQNLSVGEQAVQAATGGPVSSVAGSSASGGSSGSSNSSSPSTSSTYSLTGLAGVLQHLDAILNPTKASGGGSGGFLGLFTGATETDIVQSIEGLAIRLFFAAGFGVIAYLGIKTITGTGRGGTAGVVVDLVQSGRRQTLAETRAASTAASQEATTSRQQGNAQALSERRAAADAAAQQRANTTRTYSSTRVSQSTILHGKIAEPYKRKPPAPRSYPNTP